MKNIIRSAKKTLIWTAVLVLLFEEWLWDSLRDIGKAISDTLHFEQIEIYLSNTTPRMAIVVLLVPFALVTPLNIYIVALLADGRILDGVILECISKLFTTLVISRVFYLTKPQLLTVGWFNWLYLTITHYVSWAHAKIKETHIHAQAMLIKNDFKRMIVSIKAKCRALFNCSNIKDNFY